jgi:hypothetical protein
MDKSYTLHGKHVRMLVPTPCKPSFQPTGICTLYLDAPQKDTMSALCDLSVPDDWAPHTGILASRVKAKYRD